MKCIEECRVNSRYAVVAEELPLRGIGMARIGGMWHA